MCTFVQTRISCESHVGMTIANIRRIEKKGARVFMIMRRAMWIVFCGCVSMNEKKKNWKDVDGCNFVVESDGAFG